MTVLLQITMQDLRGLTCPTFRGSSVIAGVGNDSNRTLHIQSLNPMCMQSFISISCPAFKAEQEEKEKEKCMVNNFSNFLNISIHNISHFSAAYVFWP